MAGYGDNAGFSAYVTANGYGLPAGTSDDQITAARSRGAQVIDRHERRFPGTRTGGFAQDRAWPRAGAATYYGEAIAPDIIPVAIVYASYEAALLELTNPGSLSPVVTGSAVVRRESVGSLAVEYAGSSTTSAAEIAALATPVVTVIEGLLWPFLYQLPPAVLVV